MAVARYVHTDSDWTNLMTLADLVDEMRGSQKSFFRTRDSADLSASKDAERRVDEALRIISAAKAEAHSLFADLSDTRGKPR